MNTLIAFLRGINVGGHRIIKMQELRDMFETMGFKKVKTYIQSGNVVFNSDKNDPYAMSRSIREQIKSDFGHDVPVMIRTKRELKNLIDHNPFDGQNEEPFRLYVTFFLENPRPEKQEELIAQSSNIEKFEFLDGHLFSLINKKTDQKVNYSNNYVERLIGIPATGRNWKSVNKIYEIAVE